MFRCLPDATFGSQRRLAFLIGCFLISTLNGCGAGVSPEQKEALSKLQGLGARVNFERGGYQIDLTNTPVEDQDLAQLRHIPKLKNVNLAGTAITDEGVPHLLGLESLEVLALQRTRISKEAQDKIRQAYPQADLRF